MPLMYIFSGFQMKVFHKQQHHFHVNTASLTNSWNNLYNHLKPTSSHCLFLSFSNREWARGMD